MSERRAKQRSLCSDIVEVFWSDRLGWPHRAKAILEDISPTGACVQTEMLIPLETELALRLGDLGLPGKVRYSTLIGGNYFVGIEFIAGNHWSPEEYNPKHIFNWSSDGATPGPAVGHHGNLHVTGEAHDPLDQVATKRWQERIALGPSQEYLSDPV
jgi:hypothetical protein